MLFLFSFLRNTNSADLKLYEGLTIRVKNLPTQWETKEENHEYKTHNQKTPSSEKEHLRKKSEVR